MDDLPLVAGGQGRTAQSVTRDAMSLVAIVAAALVFGALMGIGYWLSGALGLVD